MATIHVKDETYERLAREAADQMTTVDDLVEPVLDKLAASVSVRDGSRQGSAEKRQKAFGEWMAAVEARAGKYPPGFIADDSREGIYAGRGE
jgi:hypothetical protein